MAIEIVDLPINSMVIFHSELLVYQRVTGTDWTQHMNNMTSMGIATCSWSLPIYELYIIDIYW